MSFFDVRQIYDYLDRVIRQMEYSNAIDYTRRFEQMEMLLMALDQNVQDLIDAVAADTSLVASVVAGQKIEADMIAALQKQVADLEAQIAAGAAIDPADLAAITKAVSDLKDANTALAAAVPAST